jgi:hypothetical protein
MEREKCPITLEYLDEYAETEKQKLPCGHQFHKPSLQKSFETLGPKCPVCRYVVDSVSRDPRVGILQSAGIGIAEIREDEFEEEIDFDEDFPMIRSFVNAAPIIWGEHMERIFSSKPSPLNPPERLDFQRVLQSLENHPDTFVFQRPVARRNKARFNRELIKDASVSHMHFIDYHQNRPECSLARAKLEKIVNDIMWSRLHIHCLLCALVMVLSLSVIRMSHQTTKQKILKGIQCGMIIFFAVVLIRNLKPIQVTDFNIYQVMLNSYGPLLCPHCHPKFYL